MEALPTFKYHPDPIASGSIIESKAECICCEKSRGYIYQGPSYCEEDIDERLCPWCIADGSAQSRFDVEFVAEFEGAPAQGGGVQSASIPNEVMNLVSHRTPGINSWQQDRWLVCCGDAAIYLGSAGKHELESKLSEAIPAIRLESRMEKDSDWNRYFGRMAKDGSPTAYIFQCLHCKRISGYSDCD